MSEKIALEVNGQAITLSETLRSAKWPSVATFIKEAADAAIVRQAAVERSITVSDEEVQQAADAFRVEQELYDPQRTDEWLAANYLSYPEWESLLEDEVIRRKLREELTSRKVERYFAEQRTALDAATISHIVVKQEDVARELRAQIVEEEADFHALAREYSLDLVTRPAGGYLGRKRRLEMTSSMEAAVFGAQLGKTVGPIKTEDGWELVKIEAFHLATLDEAMRETIKSLLFKEWLTTQRQKANIKFKLLENQSD